MFETPGQPSPGGGITLVKKAEFVPSKGKGGVLLFLYVADLEGWEEVCLDCILLLCRPRLGFKRVEMFVLLFGTFIHMHVLHQQVFSRPFQTPEFPCARSLEFQH